MPYNLSEVLFPTNALLFRLETYQICADWWCKSCWVQAEYGIAIVYNEIGCEIAPT